MIILKFRFPLKLLILLLLIVSKSCIGDIIRLGFSTAPGDIALQVCIGDFSKEDNQEIKYIFPNARVDSNVTPIEGEFIVPFVGFCLFQFDNSFSWLTSKNLTYKITLRKVLYLMFSHVVYGLAVDPCSRIA